MGISEKMKQLNSIKTDIKQALIDKGVDMANVPFTEYSSKMSGFNIKNYIYKDGVWDTNYPKLTSGTVDFNDTNIKMNADSRLVFGNLVEGKRCFIEFYCANYDPGNTGDIAYGFHVSVVDALAAIPTHISRITQIYYQSVYANKTNVIGIDQTSQYCFLMTGRSQIAYITKIWYE